MDPDIWAGLSCPSAHAVAVGDLVSTGIDRANKTPAVARVGNEEYVDAALFEPIEPSLDLGAQDPLGRACSGPGMETTEEKRFVEAISVRSFHPLRLPSPMTSKSKNNEVAGVTYGIQPLHGGPNRIAIGGVVHQNC